MAFFDSDKTSYCEQVITQTVDVDRYHCLLVFARRSIFFEPLGDQSFRSSANRPRQMKVRTGRARSAG